MSQDAAALPEAVEASRRDIGRGPCIQNRSGRMPAFTFITSAIFRSGAHGLFLAQKGRPWLYSCAPNSYAGGGLQKVVLLFV